MLNVIHKKLTRGDFEKPNFWSTCEHIFFNKIHVNVAIDKWYLSPEILFSIHIPMSFFLLIILYYFIGVDKSLVCFETFICISGDIHVYMRENLPTTLYSGGGAHSYSFGTWAKKIFRFILNTFWTWYKIKQKYYSFSLRFPRSNMRGYIYLFEKKISIKK